MGELLRFCGVSGGEKGLVIDLREHLTVNLVREYYM